MWASIIYLNNKETHYRITRNGKVWSEVGRGKFLVPTLVTRGDKTYPFVTLRVDGKSARKAVAELVATAYCQKIAGATEVLYLDGDPSNCNAENLCWATRGAQLFYNAAAGLYGTMKLRPVEVETIRKDGRTLVEIAYDYDISTTEVSLIKNNKVWTFV